MRSRRSILRPVLLLAALAALWPSVLIVPAVAAGDPAAGRQVFQTRCMICHSPVAGRNMVGPTLFGIVGSKSAEVPNYNFSPVLRGLNVTWDDATLDRWLTNPRAMAPGTKMSFTGIPDAQQRANLIAYLATLK